MAAMARLVNEKSPRLKGRVTPRAPDNPDSSYVCTLAATTAGIRSVSTCVVVAICRVRDAVVAQERRLAVVVAPRTTRIAVVPAIVPPIRGVSFEVDGRERRDDFGRRCIVVLCGVTDVM